TTSEGSTLNKVGFPGGFQIIGGPTSSARHRSLARSDKISRRRLKNLIVRLTKIDNDPRWIRNSVWPHDRKAAVTKSRYKVPLTFAGRRGHSASSQRPRIRIQTDLRDERPRGSRVTHDRGRVIV